MRTQKAACWAAAWVLLLLVSETTGRSESLFCGGKTTAVYFGNGVLAARQKTLIPD